MKRFVFAIFIIFSVICALTSCSIPIGTLENNKANYQVDIMWLVPRRQLYQLDEKFVRMRPPDNQEKEADFQIFIVDKGGVVEIPPEDPGVTVEIRSGIIDLPSETRVPVTTPYHTFYKVGTHRVFVTFGGKEAWYALEVFSPNNGNSLGGDDGIGIIWLD
jgi:hypothetical protein